MTETLPPLPESPICDLCGTSVRTAWWEYRTFEDEHVGFQDPRWLACSDCHDIVHQWKQGQYGQELCVHMLAQRQLRIFRNLHDKSRVPIEPLDNFMRIFLTHIDGEPKYEVRAQG